MTNSLPSIFRKDSDDLNQYDNSGCSLRQKSAIERYSVSQYSFPTNEYGYDFDNSILKKTDGTFVCVPENEYIASGYAIKAFKPLFSDGIQPILAQHNVLPINYISDGIRDRNINDLKSGFQKEQIPVNNDILNFYDYLTPDEKMLYKAQLECAGKWKNFLVNIYKIYNYINNISINEQNDNILYRTIAYKAIEYEEYNDNPSNREYSSFSELIDNKDTLTFKEISYLAIAKYMSQYKVLLETSIKSWAFKRQADLINSDFSSIDNYEDAMYAAQFYKQFYGDNLTQHVDSLIEMGNYYDNKSRVLIEQCDNIDNLFAQLPLRKTIIQNTIFDPITYVPFVAGKVGATPGATEAVGSSITILSKVPVRDMVIVGTGNALLEHSNPDKTGWDVLKAGAKAATIEGVAGTLTNVAFDGIFGNISGDIVGNNTYTKSSDQVFGYTGGRIVGRTVKNISGSATSETINYLTMGELDNNTQKYGYDSIKLHELLDNRSINYDIKYEYMSYPIYNMLQNPIYNVKSGSRSSSKTDNAEDIIDDLGTVNESNQNIDIINKKIDDKIDLENVDNSTIKPNTLNVNLSLADERNKITDSGISKISNMYNSDLSNVYDVFSNGVSSVNKSQDSQNLKNNNNGISTKSDTSIIGNIFNKLDSSIKTAPNDNNTQNINKDNSQKQFHSKSKQITINYIKLAQAVKRIQEKEKNKCIVDV